MMIIRALRFGRTTPALLVLCSFFGLLAPEGAFGQGVGASNAATAVVKADGSLWTWGGNDAGQLGTGTSGGIETVPVRVPGDTWKQVAVGGSHMVAVRSDGSLWSWGNNDQGQLGRNSGQSDPTPGRIGSQSYWEAVAAGESHNLALDSEGNVWVWGSNFSGQLGNNSTASRSTPLKLNAGPFAAVSAGTMHSLAVGIDHSLWAWGSNASGQLGTDTIFSNSLIPFRVGTSLNWRTVAAGGEHSLAIRSDGSLWSWGRNLEGQLGHGVSGFSAKEPRAVAVGTIWQKIAGGSVHTLAIRGDGTLWTWGHGFFGQLGHGGNAQENAPRKLGVDGDWVDMAGGASHSVALKSDGVIWSSGLNENGQLGNGATEKVFELSPSSFGLPDLLLTGLTPGNDLVLGQTFTINVFGENIGSGDVGSDTPISIEVRLSEFPEWDHPNHEVLGTFPVSENLSTGDGFNASPLLTLPARLPSGNYYFGARILESDGISESDYENNIFWMEMPTPFLADLSVAPPTPAAVTVQPEENLDFNIEVRNTGLGDVPAGTSLAVQVRLSRNQIWGDGDDLVLASSHSIAEEIRVGEPLVIPFSSLIPEHAVEGNYHLGAWIDIEGLIVEQNDANNRSWSAEANITVNRPSLSDVLDSGFAWTASGNSAWFAQSNDFQYGSGAAQSPPLEVGQEAGFEAQVAGPSVITFDWKIDSQREGNYLALFVDQVERARISGNVDWESRSFLLSAPLSHVRWAYVKGETTDGLDRAWVDLNSASGPDYWVQDVNKPDLLVSGIEYEPGSYVLDRDSLNVTAIGKNQGSSLSPLPAGFKMEARLSPTREWDSAESIVLGDLTKFRDIDSDDRFVYRANFELPLHAPDGDYYLGIFVDSGELVDEFDFEVNNNVRWTSAPDVTIERRPDFEVLQLDHDGGYYTIFPGDGKKEELQVSFDIQNRGLADVPGIPYRIQVLLTPDREIGNGNDSILLDFEETGLSQGQTRTYGTTIEMPVGTRLGELLYLAVVVDADNAISTLQPKYEKFSTDPDVFVTEVPVEQAVQSPGTSFRFPEGTVPWFAQRDEAFEETFSAQSGRTGNEGVSAMETVVILDAPSLVAFYWKVSSEFSPPKEDFLAFSINDEEVARIRGEVDWNRVAFPLPAGESVLKWSYSKDLSGASGADAGWVDRITYTVPNLTVQSLEETYTSGAYRSGDTFEVTVPIENLGEQEVQGAFHVELRLSQDLDWGNSDDVVLGTERVVDIASQGLVGSYKEVTFTVAIPENLTFDGNYYVAAKVDSLGEVVESKEDNNVRFSQNRDVELTPNVNMAEALDNAVNPFDPIWIDGGWDSGGDGLWYGIQDTSSLVLELGLQEGDFQGTWVDVPASPGKRPHKTSVPVAEGEPVPTGSFSFEAPEIGNYDVYIWHAEPGASSRPEAAEFVIAHAEGQTTVTVDQTAAGGEWVRIASALPFDGQGSVSVANTLTGGEDDGTALSFGGVRLVGVSSSSWDGEDSVRSGAIDIHEMSWLERKIEVRPTAPAEIVFRWKVSSRPNSGFLTFRISGQQQKSISGDSGGWIEERFFIPAGPQILRWEYSKNNSDFLGADAGFLDSVEIREVDKPDLIVESLNYTPGEYVLERDNLPVQIVVENQGIGLISEADVEVRLSADRIWGSDGDIVLGNFTNVVLDSTNRLVFSGGIELPLNAPEGDYYLAVLVNPNEEVDEYDHANNFLWTPARDVTIRHLPDLVMTSWLYDFLPFDPLDLTIRRTYDPGSVIRFNFSMVNEGLGELRDTDFSQEIQLRARRNPTADPSDDFNWAGNSILVQTLADVVERDLFMPGAPFDPEPIDYQLDLILPQELELMQILGILPPNATVSTISEGNRAELANEYEFSLIYIMDATGAVDESDEANVFSIGGLGRFRIKSHDTQNMESWAEERDLGDLPDDGTTEFEDRLKQYALDQSPHGLAVNTSGFRFGSIVIDGVEYFSPTFSLVKAATDLRYTVEVSNDLQVWVPLIILEPPYNHLHGTPSLTGRDGLIHHPLVEAASDQGYTAAITIRDNTPMTTFENEEGVPSRFFRLLIEKK